jgi:hypothetical protein
VDTRISRSPTAINPALTARPQDTAAPAPTVARNEVAKPLAFLDRFEPAANRAARGCAEPLTTGLVHETSSIETIRALTADDPAQLMRDLLTGAVPPPEGFAEVMGYSPVMVENEWGVRMRDPYGDCSAPGGIGPDGEFKAVCKTHDYGYDLLRYFDRVGAPLGPEARKAADAVFRADLFAYSETKDGFWDRWQTKAWAQAYATAVELNSRAQGYGAP